LLSPTVIHLAAADTPAAPAESLVVYPEPPTREPPSLPTLPPGLPSTELDFPPSQFSVSSASSIASPLSPQSPQSPQSPGPNEAPSFCHSESEDDDAPSGRNEHVSPERLSAREMAGADADAFGASLLSAFAGYRLPRTSVDGKGTAAAPGSAGAIGSPALIARDLSEGNTTLLGAPSGPGLGLDDLVSELGWIAHAIQGKDA